VVTRVSPPIFGLQHCVRFRKRMQLNMGGVLTRPKVVVHKSLGGSGWLISVLLLSLQGDSGPEQVTCKDTPMPKSALVMSEYLNNLMRNQCIEQCAIYTILPVGPTWDGLSGPIIPFLAILGSSASWGNYQRILWGVFGIRYSAMRIYRFDWLRCESGLLGEISETWGMVVCRGPCSGKGV